MKFSTIVMKLFFCLLLHLHQVSSSTYLVSENVRLFNGDMENIFEKFVVNLKIAYLRKNKPRHITIVGATDNDLRQVQPLFKSYPYIVCKDPEECMYTEQLSRGSLVIIFFNDISQESVDNKSKILSNCRKCKVLFVYEGNIQVNDIQFIFAMATGQNVHKIEFAHIVKNEVQIYSRLITKNCSSDVQLRSVWKPGIKLREIHTWAFRLIKDLNGCPISVSSLTFRPKMLIEEKNNATLTVTGGREGKLLLAIAKKLNFSIDLRYPSIVDRMKYSRKKSIINDVISGTVEMGIGRILPNNDIHKVVAFSMAYDEECVTWGVPLVMNPSNNIAWVEFSWEVWVLFGLIFVVICAIVYADQNSNLSTKGEQRNLGFVTIVLDILAIHLGNPVVHISSSLRGKIMLIVYLYYAIIMTTAYKSYLSAILSSDKGTPMFVTEEDLIKQNITVGGSLYDYNILKEQVSERKLTSQLMKRYVINNNDTETFHRLKYTHDYAFLARLSSMNYQKLKMIREEESITFDTLKGCVLTYPTVIVFRITSFVRKAADKIIRRLLEAGVLDHWDLDEIYTKTILERGDLENYSKNSDKFLTIFILYSICIVVCLVIFFVEQITGRLKSKKE